MAVPILERFKNKIAVCSMSGCWLWNGVLRNDGYAPIGIGRKTFLAHRISWELFKGTIPQGLCVLHRCDVKNCVNPDHLFTGTVADNNNDRMMKGRSRPAKGEQSGAAKLSNETVLFIRQSADSNASLARKFGVSAAIISYARHRKTWKHI